MLQEKMMGPSIKMEEARKIVEAMLKEAMKDPERPTALSNYFYSKLILKISQAKGFREPKCWCAFEPLNFI